MNRELEHGNREKSVCIRVLNQFSGDLPDWAGARLGASSNQRDTCRYPPFAAQSGTTPGSTAKTAMRRV